MKVPNYATQFLPESLVQQMSCVIEKLIPKELKSVRHFQAPVTVTPQQEIQKH